MADAPELLPQHDSAPLEPRPEILDTEKRQRLLVVTPPPNRGTRPVTSLANVFGRFAEMQQLVGDQVIALEESVAQHGQHLADISAQLPDMKERINWLIASYYEDDRQNEDLRKRLAQQEAAMVKMSEAVRQLCESQAQWRHTMDQLLQIFGRVQSLSLPEAPQFPE